MFQSAQAAEYSEYSCMYCHKSYKACTCNTHPEATPLTACELLLYIQNHNIGL